MTARNSDSLWLFLRLAVLIGLGFLAHKAFAAEPPSPPPLVYLIALDPEAEEAGADSATFLVLRIGETNEPLMVLYEVAGTAANGVDYETLPGVAVIPAGSYFAELTLTPIDDGLVEGTEVVLVGLEQPLVWPPPYIAGWPSIALAAIVDDDLAPTNQPPSIALVNPPDGSVFMSPADIRLVARAADRDGRVHHVEFFAGTNSLGSVTNHPRLIRHRLPILALNDDPSFEIDPEELPDFRLDPTPIDPTIIPGNLFQLLWEDVPPGRYLLTAVATDNDGATTRSEPVEIRVTEPPPQPIVNVIAVDPIAAEGPAPTDPADVLNTATFAIKRSGNTNIPLTVYYRLSGTASNGVDYESLPHSVEIPAGQRGARIVVVPIDDALVEGAESVVLTLVPPVCIAIFPPPPDCYLVGRQDTARAVIRDNDSQPTNRPPLVEIVRPLDGSVFLVPADIAIVAQARDFDGRVVRVEFFEGTNSLGTVSNNIAALTPHRPPLFLVWSNVPRGHYVLHAEATDNDGATSRSRPVEIKVVERTVPPTVNIEATVASAWEAGGLSPASLTSAVNTAIFTVKRTGPTTDGLRVHYSLGGTASNGVDYRRLTGQLLIPSGAASAEIVIHPIDDLLVEGTETVIASLNPSLCASLNAALRDCYVVGTNSRALAHIRDNDVSPTNHPPRVAIVQPDDGDVFLAPADISLVAEAHDADGSVRTVEFFANGASLGIVSNRNAVIIADELEVARVDNLFRLNWSNVLAGEYVLTAKATDNRGAMSASEPVRIKVVFPEAAVVTIVARDPYASEGGFHADRPIAVDVIPIPLEDRAVFTVRRTRGTNEPLVVYYSLSGSASNGVDYTELTGEVTIPRGAWAADIVVDPVDDRLAEGTETVVAALTPIACARVVPAPPECYLVGEPRRAIAYIRDNDFHHLPRVAITSPHDGEVFHASANIPVMARALDPDGWVSQVEFFANGHSIGVAQIHFIMPPPPGQMQTFDIRWTNVVAGHYVLTAKATDNEGGASWSRRIEIHVVTPPPIPTVTIIATDSYAHEGGTNTAAFRVRRDCCTSNELTVWYAVTGSASNGVDYAALSGHVTIPAGARSARIVVAPVDDNRVEEIETVVLELQPSPLAGPNLTYEIGRPEAAAAIIVDNDEALPESRRLADGLMHLSAPAVDGVCYRIEATSDFVNWEVLCRNTARGNRLHFTEPRSRDFPRRFYRVVPDICEDEE
ncbi:MAG TPA: Ig-like domain-containing protein [Methylomirabilota bacterium]|nr:Ig-like domain-containing protein [Methylomirabilota bacterium]